MNEDADRLKYAEWLTREEMERLEHYRDFHLTMPTSEESERQVHVTIIRDEDGVGGS